MAKKTTDTKAAAKPETKAKEAPQDKAITGPANPEPAPQYLVIENVRQMNIYQKLAAITGEIGVVEKGGTNTEQKYAFIEYAAVAGKLRVLFAKYGVVVVPRMQKAAEQHREEITTKYGSKGVNVLIDFTFDIVNADQPTDKFSVDWVGEAADYGDKGTNKAATAALKYYLMRQFNISEKGEDPDGTTIDRGEVSKQEAAPAPPAKKPLQFITSSQIATLKQNLVAKGIKSQDTEQMLLQLAKAEDVKNITAATAQALLTKIENAKPQAMKDYFYGPETEAEGSQEPPEPPVEVDEAFKQEAKEALDSLGLNARGRMWLKKEVSGIAYGGLEKLTDQQWRDLATYISNILDGTVEVADDYIAGFEENVDAEPPADDEPAADQEPGKAVGWLDDETIAAADAATDEESETEQETEGK